MQLNRWFQGFWGGIKPKRPLRLPYVIPGITAGVIGAVLMTVLVYPVTPAQAEGHGTGLSCGVCHPAILEEWKQSAHARAYTDPLFQEWLKDAEHPEECLVCHTTNYNLVTGKYEAENIDCVACHIDPPSDHPDSPIVRPDDAKMCGECHEVTYREWATSKHAQAGMQCADCHHNHERSLRFASPQETCLSCHTTRMDDYAHASHQGANLTCAECHIFRDPDAPIPVTGLAATSHAFDIPTRGCLRCHEEQREAEPTPEAPSTVGVEAAFRIAELEAQVAAQENSRGTPPWLIMQGGLAGIVVGIVMTWLWRAMRGREQ